MVMTDAELKLTLFRRIDQLSGKRLRMLFTLISKNLDQPIEQNLSYKEKLEAEYAAMAADTLREAEATEWIEGVLNHEDL
ncbi:MAG: hypothetical protein D6730_13665 [Bacteroidetes bacterium]|nr:MAG: hypothetical protein D6730_13665 [Bacteroidota bacterium]